jgi:hypothetical protein
MSVKHEIRNPKGGTMEVTLTPLTAIVQMCRECLGYELDPADCTSPLCACYPFRTGDAHSGKTMSEENRNKARARLAEIRNSTVSKTT